MLLGIVTYVAKPLKNTLTPPTLVANINIGLINNIAAIPAANDIAASITGVISNGIIPAYEDIDIYTK